MGSREEEGERSKKEQEGEEEIKERVERERKGGKEGVCGEEREQNPLTSISTSISANLPV